MTGTPVCETVIDCETVTIIKAKNKNYCFSKFVYLEVIVSFRAKCTVIFSQVHPIIIEHISDFILLQSQLKPDNRILLL